MHWKDDDPEPITGPRPKQTKGMYARWMDAVADVVRYRRGTPEMAPQVFNANIATMREQYSVEAISNAFVRFAAAVDAGSVAVQNKPAWFVFMRLRHRFLVEPNERRGDPLARAKESERGKKKVATNPFRRGRQADNPFRK
jgi:hypothetical protein